VAVSLIVAMFCAWPARAALDFYTYQILDNRTTVVKNGVAVDSSYTSYQLARLGSVSLEASTLALTSHGNYLSVVETATLSGNTEQRPEDITYDFLFQGSLPIPPLAAVHSLTVFHGDTAYPATLRKQVYSLDNQFLDTTRLQATLAGRVAFLQQLGDRSFEATFSKISLGEPIRVRLEYDLPFPGAPGTEVHVPVVFHPSGTPPRQAQISFTEAAKGMPVLQWLGPTGRVTLDDQGSHTLDYGSEYLFRRDEDSSTLAAMQMTGFTDGNLKGQYLLFQGGLSDSMMDVLSRPLETAFLWRWNPPLNLVEFQAGLKTLSAEGRLAAAEAQAMKKIILEMAPHGHRFGLMHSVAGKDPIWFPPAEAGSDGYKRLLDYLDGFTEQRIYADYKDYKDPRPDWAATAWKDSGEVAASRSEFLADLATIRKGFSDRADIMRHIEMLGIGSTPASEIDLKDPKVIESALDSVTLSALAASWLGVDLGAALKTKANADLRPVTVDADLGYGPVTLMLPVFQPSSVEYRAFSGGRSFALIMPFSSKAGREAALKADAAFDDSLQLQGIDALGLKTRAHTLSPRVLRAAGDTALARLWAADPDRIADREESDLGMRYGILTKGSYLAAGIAEGKIAEGNVAILPKSVRLARGRVFRIQGDWLMLEAPERMAAGAWLEIFDMQGKRLGRLSLDAFRAGNGFAIPLARLADFRAARLVLVLRGGGRAQTFTLALGGRP
jgi:hypothetical protein